MVAEVLMIRRLLAAFERHAAARPPPPPRGRRVPPPARALLVLPYVSIVAEKAEHLERVMAPMLRSVGGRVGGYAGADTTASPLGSPVGYLSTLKLLYLQGDCWHTTSAVVDVLLCCDCTTVRSIVFGDCITVCSIGYGVAQRLRPAPSITVRHMRNFPTPASLPAAGRGGGCGDDGEGQQHREPAAAGAPSARAVLRGSGRGAHGGRPAQVGALEESGPGPRLIHDV